jgi:hypothetical protein
MSRFYYLILFILLNIIWIFYIWRSDVNIDEFSPKFISSSFDSKSNIRFNSKVLQSVSPYLFKLFPSSSSIITSHTGDIPIGSTPMMKQIQKEKEFNLSLLYKSDIAKNKINSEYEMFLDENKENIYIIQFHINYNYTNDYSLINLYTIPIHNFIISKREEYDLNKSCIVKLWEKKFHGIIQKYAISNDKKYIGILLNIISKNDIKNVIEYIEIFNLTNIDEINIKGNLPLISIDVAKDLIIISRETKEYTDIFIKNTTSNIWEENNINNITTKSKKLINENKKFEKIIYSNNINSFKIVENNENNISIIESYISITNKGINANLILLFLNKNISETKKYDILSVRLDSSIEGDYGEKENEISYIYDMKSSLSQLKYMYFHNPIFSKNNLNKNKNIIFELFYRTLMSINKETYERNIISSIYSEIKSIQSDENENNLIITNSKGDLYYFYRQNLNEEYLDYFLITLDNIPPKYKNKEILTSYIETFNNDKTRLFLLMDNGVIISVDFRKIIKKMNRSIITMLFMDYFYTIFMALFNLAALLYILKKRKKKNQRNNDIRNVINNLAQIRRENN